MYALNSTFGLLLAGTSQSAWSDDDDNNTEYDGPPPEPPSPLVAVSALALGGTWL